MSAARGGSSHEYGPSRLVLVLAAVLGVVLAVLAIRAVDDGDRTGLLLLGGGALVVLGACGWAAAGPVLRLSCAGVVLRQPIGSVSYSWSQVSSLAAASQRRRGLAQHSLEIEAADQLHVIPDWLLGLREGDEGRDLAALVAQADALRASVA